MKKISDQTDGCCDIYGEAKKTLLTPDEYYNKREKLMERQPKKENMKIYAIKTQGETEWICANTIFEALKFYHSLNELDIIDFGDTDDIEIVPEDKWGELTIIDPEQEDEDGSFRTIMTFKEYMEDNTEVGIIATTAY